MSSELYTALRDRSRDRIGREWTTADHLALMENAKRLEAMAEDWKILAEKQQMERAIAKAKR